MSTLILPWVTYPLRSFVLRMGKLRLSQIRKNSYFLFDAWIHYYSTAYEVLGLLDFLSLP